MDLYILYRDMVPKRACLKKRSDGAFLVVESRQMNICYLNGTAADIFDLIDGVKTVDEIKEELLGEYSIKEDTLKDELMTALRDMQAQGFIRLSARKDAKHRATEKKVPSEKDRSEAVV